jgi:type 1 fimbria pilin
MKTTTIRLAALATMLTAASIGAHAAESADLAVQGMIRPSACNVSLSGNGTVDFGTISALTLSETEATVLPSRDFTLTVTCDASTTAGYSITDSRPGTANSTAGSAVVNSGTHWFGLGDVDGMHVGAFRIMYDASTSQATADGGNVDAIYSQNGGAWTMRSDRNVWAQPGYPRLHSWAPTGTTAPGSYSTMVQPFTITAAIAPTSELPDLTNNIPLDGLATFTLVYL